MGSKGSKSKAKKGSELPAPAKRDYDFLWKILIVGDSGVGKSSLLLRFADSTFTDQFISTIGVDFKTKKVNVDNRVIKLQIWDTAGSFAIPTEGQEKFKSPTSSYYRGAQAVLLCYDITNRDSFTNLAHWLPEIKRHAPENVYNAVAACKTDLENQRVVREEEAAEFCDRRNLPQFATSAQSGSGVEEVFLKIAYDLLKKYEE